MWNPNPYPLPPHQDHDHVHEEDSWEVRAFAEDTRNLMAITWPPTSYSCSFCSRLFKSAQALGGHMNLHRRHLPHRPGAAVKSPAKLRRTSCSSLHGSEQISCKGDDGHEIKLDLELRLGQPK